MTVIYNPVLITDRNGTIRPYPADGFRVDTASGYVTLLRGSAEVGSVAPGWAAVCQEGDSSESLRRKLDEAACREQKPAPDELPEADPVVR